MAALHILVHQRGGQPVRYMPDRAQICTNPDVSAAQIVTTKKYQCIKYYVIYGSLIRKNIVCCHTIN